MPIALRILGVLAAAALGVVLPRAGAGEWKGLKYTVEFRGIPGPVSRSWLESVAGTLLYSDRLPESLTELERRAGRDVPVLVRALRAEGYYAARVVAEVIPGKIPLRVVFALDSGPEYRFTTVEIEVNPGFPGLRESLPSPEALGLVPGRRARAEIILASSEACLAVLEAEGYPFAAEASRRVVVDHAAASVSVRLVFAPGPPARFGAVSFSGLERTREEYCREHLPWREGEPYNAGLVRRFRDWLSATRLFSLVRIEHPPALGEDNLLPLEVSVRERARRTLKAGVGYRTDEGPMGLVSWEDRNLLGRAEVLGFEARASGIGFSGRAGYRKPDFLASGQVLDLSVKGAREFPDAYTSSWLRALGLLERKLGTTVTAGAGAGIRFSRVEQSGDEENYVFLLLPLKLDWDGSDDLLDPARGFRLALEGRNFLDARDASIGFLAWSANASAYLEIFSGRRLVLAGRAEAGGTVGAGQFTVPADERFYAGGGGSIRGYPYQTVGPLDADDDPVGGRALVEINAELRARIWGDLGLAAFLDGGTAFEAPYPEFEERPLLWGTGFGFRYYLAGLPLRADVGFPLNRRPGVDGSFQVYVSLGQAF